MKFIEKVAGYFTAYTSSSAKEGIMKVAEEDGVTPDDIAAFHNLTEGNIFTGRNIVKVASEEPNSKLMALGMALDKLATEEDFTFDDVYAYAEQELDMDREDVDFVVETLNKQAEEAGLMENETDDVAEKIATAMDLLESNGIHPIDGLFIGATLGEDNLIVDEKVAEEAAENGFEPEDLQKIAEAVSIIGGIDENILHIAEDIYDSVNS